MRWSRKKMRVERENPENRRPPARPPVSGKVLAALEGEHERVNGDGFRQRHADDGDHENVTEGTRIAAHGLRRPEAHETDTDTGAGTGDAEREGTVEVARSGHFSGFFEIGSH